MSRFYPLFSKINGGPLKFEGRFKKVDDVDVKGLDIMKPEKTYLEDVIDHRSPITLIRPYVNFFRDREGLSLFHYGEVLNSFTLWMWFYPLCVEYYKEKYET